MPYRGLVATIPIGTEGLTGSESLTVLRPTQLIEARNVSYENGVIQKEGGAAKYNTTAITGTPTILGGHDWWPDQSTQRMIVYTDAGTLLRDTGAGTFATTLATGLSTTAVPVFVEGGKEAAANNRKLFVFNGADAVQVLSGDGLTTAALATPPADWATTNQPSFGANHEGRLWGGGNANDPYRLYYSTPGNHEDFTGAGSGSISVYPGEGETLVAAIPYKGLLLAFKWPTGIYAIDTTDPTVANWRVDRITNTVGMPSPRAFAIIGDDDAIVWLDQVAHIHVASGIQEFGNVRSTNLTKGATIAPFLRDNINLGRLAQCQAAYYDTKEEFHLCLSETNVVVNDRRLVIDFNGQVPRFAFQDRDTNESIWLRKDSDNIQRLMVGDDAGFVWQLDQPTKNKDGVAYESSFRLPDMDMAFLDPALRQRRKNGAWLELVLEPTDNASVISVNLYWDQLFSETVVFNTGATGIGLGSFVIGTHQLGPINAVADVRRRIRGSGRRLSIEPVNGRLNEDFKMSGAQIGFTAGSERA